MVLTDNGLMRIRPASIDELPRLQDIERAAGQCFRDVGMPEVAEDEPLPVGELARYRHTGLAWVAVDPADVPVAYLIAEPVDGNLHIEQVSVHPDQARRERRPWTEQRYTGSQVSAHADPGPPVQTVSGFLAADLTQPRAECAVVERMESAARVVGRVPRHTGEGGEGEGGNAVRTARVSLGPMIFLCRDSPHPCRPNEARSGPAQGVAQNHP